MCAGTARGEGREGSGVGSHLAGKRSARPEQGSGAGRRSCPSRRGAPAPAQPWPLAVSAELLRASSPHPCGTARASRQHQVLWGALDEEEDASATASGAQGSRAMPLALPDEVCKEMQPRGAAWHLQPRGMPRGRARSQLMSPAAARCVRGHELAAGPQLRLQPGCHRAVMGQDGHKAELTRLRTGWDPGRGAAGTQLPAPSSLRPARRCLVRNVPRPNQQPKMGMRSIWT